MQAPAPKTPPTALLHAKIPQWFTTSARDLPWRRPDRTPWGVMVSEFMLQQTPVNRVLPVWQDWLGRWPAAPALAEASPANVLRAWGRLGYPRRALRLHAAAVVIVDRHRGEVPASAADLLALPGVGSYTAAAIASFAFGTRETVVDTNIRRVYARLVSAQALPAPSLTAAEIRLAHSLLPAGAAESALWNAAVMELGAVVCTARAPKCSVCPVREHCAWLAAGCPEAERLPRGQAWIGTDRRVRGAMMAVLRASEEPVSPELLLGLPALRATARRPDSTGAVDLSLTALHSLGAPAEQLDRALAGLVSDGLACRVERGISLPN